MEWRGASQKFIVFFFNNQVPFWLLQHDKFKMFAKPREKKGLLIAPSKKRKTVHTVEEINFDNDARSEYLTGFRKRKQARIKHAQGIAAEKARQEKIQLRKQVGYGPKPRCPQCGTPGVLLTDRL